MRLERFNVVRETEDKREIEYFKSIGFEEVEPAEEIETVEEIEEPAEEVEETKPKKKGKSKTDKK